MGDGALEGIQQAVAFGGGTGDEMGARQPGGYCFVIQIQDAGNLSRIQRLALMQVVDLTELFIVDHRQAAP